MVIGTSYQIIVDYQNGNDSHYLINWLKVNRRCNCVSWGSYLIFDQDNGLPIRLFIVRHSGEDKVIFFFDKNNKLKYYSENV